MVFCGITPLSVCVWANARVRLSFNFSLTGRRSFTFCHDLSRGDLLKQGMSVEALVEGGCLTALGNFVCDFRGFHSDSLVTYRSKFVQYDKVGLFGKDTYELSGEFASRAERGTWDLWRVRELSEWMQDDVCSKVFVGRMFVILGVKFAEKAKESSGRDMGTGVVLGGDRPKVMLAPAEELNAETEDWIWDSGAALDVASAAVAGKREVSFAATIFLSAGGE